MYIFPAHAPDHTVVFIDGIQELNHAGFLVTGAAEIDLLRPELSSYSTGLKINLPSPLHVSRLREL
ncbi:MAG: hypothetical protein L0220_26810 [Acidobacteria bacterium]|nr:hypothetical protein [Acidobacteriota bacterium]